MIGKQGSSHVHDMLIIGKDVGKIDKLKKDLSKYFDVKDLEPMKQIIDM